jgi:hypothetical protein
MEMVFMVHLVRLRNNWLLLSLLLTGCMDQSLPVIPAVYVNVADTGLHHHSGVLLFHDKPFAGWLYELFGGGDTSRLTSFIKGKEEGFSRLWHQNGQISEERFYVSGHKEGIHYGWWPSGRHRFTYHFKQDAYEGSVDEWYSNGTPFRYFNYVNGQEEGRQQQWWEDGTVRANYVVKNGEQFGLIGRKLCKNTSNDKP